MKKRLATIVLWVLGASVALYFGFSYLMSWQFSRSYIDTWSAMEKIAFTCEPNTDATTRAWSKAGYMRYCEPKKNGAWEAWSEGYRHVQGEYKNGKEHGAWRWFNPDGTISRTIVYDGGNVISDDAPKK